MSGRKVDDIRQLDIAQTVCFVNKYLHEVKDNYNVNHMDNK